MENKAVAAEKNDVVPFELPAPPGWKKRFTPSKSGTPRRNDIVFVSPDGDEIKNKRQLDKYLKSHPGEPPASEFDWGRGDTPRRSNRLGDKSKATETPESETPSKRQRKSSSKKGVKEDDDKQEAAGATEKETKGSDEPALPDAEDLEVQDVETASKKVLTDGDNIKNEEEKNNDAEIVPKEPSASEDKMEIAQEKEETKDEEEKTIDADIVPEEPSASEDKMEIVQEKEETKDEEKNNDADIVPEEPPVSENKMEIVQEKEETKDEEEKTNDGEIVLEEPLATEEKMEIVQEKEETLDEGNIEKLENQEAEDKSLDDSVKTDNEMLPTDAPEENKIERKSAGRDASSHSAELSKAASASQEESAEEVPVAADALNVLEENKIESKPAGADASSHSAELSKATSVSQEETAEEAPVTADALVQNSNDCKVDENEQIHREVPIEESNGTEAAAEGVNISVESNSVQEEATAIDQTTSS